MSPKLDKEQAKQTDAAESASFEAIPEGIYLGTLEEVTSKEGPQGEYWSWRFGDIISIEDDSKQPGSLWVNTSLSENAAWKLKEVFDAFEAKTGVDTDTLLGDQVQLVVSQRMIGKGARMGEIGNNVDRVMPVGADPEA